ncbi:NEDD8 ultimate buster 1-like [Lolium rigidum]|uniref:NEDD8 ultimate buster 1-like n=1 Tax=Lolium rigidum TaxID=89674 RepID=UPI001F5E2B8F|nr:NEDD8 ultimate buster 1-like [Lolium rigidum]
MASGEVPAAPPAAAAEKIRVVGAWAGPLEVELGAWTVPMLRAEVARRAGDVEPERIGLIFGGRVLKDDPATSLQQAGLKSNSKVLSNLASPDRGKAIAAEAAAAAAEEEHAARLVRLWEAAKSLSQRHSDGSFPEEDFNLDLEDQSGQKVMFGSTDDIKALKMALMLHQKAKILIKKDNYKEALDVLMMAEEAFSLCDPKLIERVDNVPMLQLDIVWCYFMLRDVSRLEVAGARLNKARLGFERSHGKDSTRFRLLQAARHADLAIYVRLELLEGVVAYYNGHTEKSRDSLSSAQSKFMQLQVPDEAMTMLMEMGYEERSSKRALKMTGYDIQASVALLCEEREKKILRRKQDQETQREILEQMKYGKTPMNKGVDMQKLKSLTTIGFEKYLAAEALRINENDAEKALDLLTDPEKNCVLQSKIQSRRKRPSHVLGAGSSRARGAAAVTASGVVNPPSLVPDLNATEGDQEQLVNNEEDLNVADGDQEQLVNNEEAVNNNGEAGNHDEAMIDEADVNEEEASASHDERPNRDVVMENELANELTGDALDDYDIDVGNEGQAIAEYLSLLESAASS